jgi:hypothetical protein
MRTMRDETTSCPRRRRFARRVGRGYTRDVIIAPMKQITLFACDAALCAAEKPDEFTVSVGRQPLVSTETEGPVCAERLVMIRRHYGDALVLMASFTGGSILMFGP